MIWWGCPMTSHDRPVPDLVPQLSRGKHRHPRKGACFMELASYLAGERWSDHPACTHPLLAAMARLEAGETADPGGTAEISLTTPAGDDDRDRGPRLLGTLGRAARPGASTGGVPARSLSERSRDALAAAPEAERWARGFTREIRTAPKGFYRYAAPNTIRQAVVGISQAYVADPDALLYDMLAGAIADCERLIGAVPAREPLVDAEAWAEACALTGTRAPRMTAR